MGAETVAGRSSGASSRGSSKLRIVTKFDTRDTFVERFQKFVFPDGMFVVTKHARAVGTRLPFVVELADSTPMIDGEAEVTEVHASERLPSDRTGMRLKFLKLTGASSELVQRMVQMSGIRSSSAAMPAARPLTGQLPAARPLSGALPTARPPTGVMPAAKPLTGQMPAAKPLTGQMPAAKPLTGQMPAAKPGALPPLPMARPPVPPDAVRKTVLGMAALNTSPRALSNPGAAADASKPTPPSPGPRPMFSSTEATVPAMPRPLYQSSAETTLPPAAVTVPRPPPGQETRTPGSAYILPANPFMGIDNEALDGFIDCTLFEDTSVGYDPTVDRARDAERERDVELPGEASKWLDRSGPQPSLSLDSELTDPGQRLDTSVPTNPSWSPPGTSIGPPPGPQWPLKDNSGVPIGAPSPYALPSAAPSPYAPPSPSAPSPYAPPSPYGLPLPAPDPTARVDLSPPRRPIWIYIAAAAGLALAIGLTIGYAMHSSSKSDRTSNKPGAPSDKAVGNRDKAPDHAAADQAAADKLVADQAAAAKATKDKAAADKAAQDKAAKAAIDKAVAAEDAIPRTGAPTKPGPPAKPDKVAAKPLPVQPPDKPVATADKAVQPPVKAPPGTGDCSIQVTSEPPAPLFVNGKAHGETPATLTVPCGQDASIVISHPRYERKEQRVKPEAGTPAVVAVTLLRPDARLSITSKPSGAAVTVNGHAAGHTPTSAKVQGFTGAKVELSMPGYKSWSSRPYVKGRAMTVSHTMESTSKPAKPPAKGKKAGKFD